MTQEKYDQIKQLLAYNLKTKQIVEITGKSSGTVSTVNRSENLKDYFGIMRKYAKQKGTQPVEVKSPKPEDFDNHNSTITLLRAIEHNQSSLLEEARLHTQYQREIIELLKGCCKPKDKKMKFW